MGCFNPKKVNMKTLKLTILLVAAMFFAIPAQAQKDENRFTNSPMKWKFPIPSFRTRPNRAHAGALPAQASWRLRF